VQFFGEQTERGWVFEKSSFLFEGRSAFERLQSIGPAKKDARNTFVVNKGRLHAWTIAVATAERAAILLHAERIHLFTCQYSKSIDRSTEARGKHTDVVQSPRVGGENEKHSKNQNQKRKRPLSGDEWEMNAGQRAKRMKYASKQLFQKLASKESTHSSNRTSTGRNVELLEVQMDDTPPDSDLNDMDVSSVAGGLTYMFQFHNCFCFYC